MKYYSQDVRGVSSSFHTIVAQLSGVELDVQTPTEEEVKLHFTNGNTTLLQVDEKNSFRDPVSIGKYL